MENNLDFWNRRLFCRVSQRQMLPMLIWDTLKSAVDQTQGEKRSHSENSTRPLKSLPYLPLAFIMVTGFAVTTIGAKILSKPIVAPFDPFSVYVDIFPGQSMSAVEAKGFLCQTPHNIYHHPVHKYCYFMPTGIISSIKVALSDDVISQITFTMRENSLKVGNLVLLTETQYFRAYSQEVCFHAGEGCIIGLTSTAAQHILFRPVRSVTFIDIDQLQ